MKDRSRHERQRSGTNIKGPLHLSVKSSGIYNFQTAQTTDDSDCTARVPQVPLSNKTLAYWRNLQEVVPGKCFFLINWDHNLTFFVIN